MTASPDRPNATIAWWLITIMAAACLLACHGLGFRIRAATAIAPAVGLAILCAGAIVGIRTNRPRLHAGAIAFLQMTLFTLLGVVLAYALAARAGPLWDGAFAAADRRLGLDWPALFAAADKAPPALWIGGFAYHSLTLQMIVCIVVLSAAGQAGRLTVAVTAAILGGFVTILISAAMPAMGNVFDPAAYRHMWPSIAWMERAMITGLRDGSYRTLDLTQLMGIVSFPSYHATLPVILAWAQRDARGWRIVAPLWAGVTIVATPVFGGHYGVDVLGGLAMAPPAIAAASRMVCGRRVTISGRRRTGFGACDGVV